MNWTGIFYDTHSNVSFALFFYELDGNFSSAISVELLLGVAIHVIVAVIIWDKVSFVPGYV